MLTSFWGTYFMLNLESTSVHLGPTASPILPPSVYLPDILVNVQSVCPESSIIHDGSIRI